MNLDGTVGEKIKVRISHDSDAIGSQSTEVRLSFEGDEDDIIRTIRAGDIDVTLPGSRLLGVGTGRGGLFGLDGLFDGLGCNRWLGGLDGFGGLGGLGGLVDLNNIPVAVIKRIEVLKDGASAIYGSEAVAGVVNIILKERVAGRGGNDMLCRSMQTILKTIIVDDESLARRGLKHRLKDQPGVEIVAEAANGREALTLIREHDPDLVFLDIQMPGMDGFDVLRALPEKDMPAIVFVTAFDEYAIKAFEAHALDYLLKPIEDERLAEALDELALMTSDDGLPQPHIITANIKPRRRICLIIRKSRGGR